MKKIIGYLLYVSGLFLLIYFGDYYQEEMRVLTGRTFNPLPSTLFSVVYPVIVGLYLALPEFIRVLRRTGKIMVDWVRVIIIGIPTLFIDISVVLYFFTAVGQGSIVRWIVSDGYSLLGRALIGVVFGYTMLMSISKAEGHISKDEIQL